MLRKGPLDQYSVESILHRAAVEGLTGGIEIQSRVSGVVYLSKGYVTFALQHGAPAPPDVAAVVRPSKETVRRHVESILCSLFAADDGWYHYDPLLQHHDDTRWVFQVDALLRDVRARIESDRPIQRWSATPLQMTATDAPFVRLTGDMWNLVVAMTGPVPSHQLRDRLGWDAERVAIALEQLQDIMLLHRDQAADPPASPPMPVAGQMPVAGEVVSWDGTLDTTPRPLRLAPEPASVGGRSSGPAPATPLAKQLDASTASPESRLSDRAPAGVATEVLAPPVAIRPNGTAPTGGPNRKSALKRLISSLRQ